MPTLPIPVFVFVALVFFTFSLLRAEKRQYALIILLGLCAAQSLIIAIARHYEVPFMRAVQPITATFIPVAAWPAYKNCTSGYLDILNMLHGLPPIFMALILVQTPHLLDAAIPSLFALYGALILLRSKSGIDVHLQSLFSNGEVPLQLWRIIALSLIASALSDVIIVFSLNAGWEQTVGWLISIFSLGNLLLVGYICLSPQMRVSRDTKHDTVRTNSHYDVTCWEALQNHMRSHRPYLDPDLTLARLARQLSVPAKTLSATINQSTHDNVSRYINEALIKEAQSFMENGSSVTSAMFASGFNTKSNFNREFKRVVGQRPTAWLAGQKL